MQYYRLLDGRQNHSSNLVNCQCQLKLGGMNFSLTVLPNSLAPGQLGADAQYYTVAIREDFSFFGE